MWKLPKFEVVAIIWIVGALSLYFVNFLILIGLNVIYAKVVVQNEQDLNMMKELPILYMGVLVALTTRVVCFMEGIKILTIYWIIGRKKMRG